MNIRNETDRAAMIEAGFKWALVSRLGEIGRVVSRHRTYDAANKAAKGRELHIVEIAEAQNF